MKWAFLISEPAFPYITSDAPVSIYDPDQTDPSIWYGYEKRRARFIFPINRNLCLEATWAGKEGYFHVDRDAVFETNALIASHALRYVFSPTQYPMSVRVATF